MTNRVTRSIRHAVERSPSQLPWFCCGKRRKIQRLKMNHRWQLLSAYFCPSRTGRGVWWERLKVRLIQMFGRMHEFENHCSFFCSACFLMVLNAKKNGTAEKRACCIWICLVGNSTVTSHVVPDQGRETKYLGLFSAKKDLKTRKDCLPQICQDKLVQKGILKRTGQSFSEGKWRNSPRNMVCVTSKICLYVRESGQDWDFLQWNNVLKLFLRDLPFKFHRNISFRNEPGTKKDSSCAEVVMGRYLCSATPSKKRQQSTVCVSTWRHFKCREAAQSRTEAECCRVIRTNKRPRHDRTLFLAKHHAKLKVLAAHFCWLAAR